MMIRELKHGITEASFLELLLDETICDGTLIIEKDLVREVGGVNDYLKCGRKYELVLRIAHENSVVFHTIREEGDIDTEKYLVLQDDPPELKACYGWQTDCYLVAKYSKELRESGYFNVAVSGILSQTVQESDAVTTYLEQMIGRSEVYYKIDDCTRPILIYRENDICYDVLAIFAEQFGKALERLGKQVLYFDLEKESVENVTRYMRQRFFAIIGIQSYMFSIKMEDECHYLHEYLQGLKYNFIFDHPIWLRNHLGHQLKDFCVLTEDSNYVNYIRKHYKYDAVLFPPAGIRCVDNAEEDRRIYDLTFVGTYSDYRNQLHAIHAMERKKRFLANHLIRVMRRNTDLSSEEAFDKVLEERELQLSEKDYLQLFYEMRKVIYCVTQYYREEVLCALLKKNIRIDAYGDSWNECYLTKYPNLICHPNVTVAESLEIFRQSKLSLNIMSWHKAGFTERMANIMLAGAVLVTDDTAYLYGRYDETDMLIFRLEEREYLAERIQHLLENEEHRYKIAEKGRKRAEREHTWQKRAEEFLEIRKHRILS